MDTNEHEFLRQNEQNDWGNGQNGGCAEGNEGNEEEVFLKPQRTQRKDSAPLRSFALFAFFAVLNGLGD